MLVLDMNYPMLHTSPIPYIQDVHEIILHLLHYISFNATKHHALDLASFHILLLFCTSKNKPVLASHVPYLLLSNLQVLAAVNAHLLDLNTRIKPLVFPSCALEYWSETSDGLAGYFFRSSQKLVNLHYFLNLDFISAETVGWEKDPDHILVKYGSKSWQRKEFC